MERNLRQKIGIIMALFVICAMLIGSSGKEIGTCFEKNMDVLGDYVDEQQDQRIVVKRIIDCYMPVIGYVDSNYIETEYLQDPSYDYESQVEYIELENDSSVSRDLSLQQVKGENAGGVSGEDHGKLDEGTITGNIGNEVVENVEQPAVQTTVQSVGTSAGQSINESLPRKFSRSELLDFSALVRNFYTVTSITELKPDKFDLEKGLNTDFTIQQDNSKPQILIFHTHSQEEFADSVPGDPNTGIVAVGAYLARILSTQYGYNVIHDTSVYDYVDGVLDRSKAYTYAEQGIQMILEQYPSVEVVLDIHRDGVADNIHLVTDVNGKPTARFMFFNGISYTKVKGDIDYLSNPYVQDNLAMSLQMYLLGNEYYPGLLRKNYINGYRYCLHFRPKSMLIEVGAQNNTLQEELNAMEPLAEMLHRLLSGEKAYE